MHIFVFLLIQEYCVTDPFHNVDLRILLDKYIRSFQED